jgi:hypothetical protein
MKYQVLWLNSALDDLTNVWTNALPQMRQAITEAGNAIDTQLGNNPDEQGESRPKGRRIEFFPPLGVIYRVDIQHAAVAIVHVWQFQKRAK